MSHHADDGYLPEEFRKQLGATGEFPEGKVTKDDEGEIKLAIGSKTGTVFIEFGKSVAWVGFTPQQARQIAMTLLQHAAAAYGVGHDEHSRKSAGREPRHEMVAKAV